MKIVGLKCPYCGAEIKAAAKRKYIKCEYCQSSLYIDHDAALPVNENRDEKRNRDNRETGRKTGSEKKMASPDNIKNKEATGESSRFTDTKRTSYEKTAAAPTYTPVSSKKHIDIGTVILWILFFPIMFSIWLLRRKSIPLFFRWLAVLMVWGLIIWLGKNYIDRHNQKPDLYKLTWPAFEHYFRDDEDKAQEAESEPVTEPVMEITEQEITETDAAAEPVTEKQTEKKTEGRYATYLKGRGNADSGRGTPQYVGVIGYAATGYMEDLILERKDSCFTTPWQVPAYEKRQAVF